MSRSPSMDDHDPSTLEGLYRDGGKLVMREGAVFPDRCVVCNAEADAEPIDFTFERSKHPYVEAALVQAIANAASDLLKGAKYTGPVHVTVPFCSWHRNKRLRLFAIGWGLMAVAAGYLLIRYLLGAHDFESLVFSLWSVIALFAGVCGIGAVSEAYYDPARVWFRTKKFYDRYVWVEGAGQEFLDTLPKLADPSSKASPSTGRSSAAKSKPDQRTGSKTRDAGVRAPGLPYAEDEDNLSAEELIRRARLAGVDDEDD